MFGLFRYINNCRTTLDTAISDTDTTILLVEAVAPMNNPDGGGGPMRFTLMDDPSAPTAIEIIGVAAADISVPVAGVVTLTNVSRGMEGTTPVAWGGGTIIFASVTAAMLELLELLQLDDDDPATRVMTVNSIGKDFVLQRTGGLSLSFKIICDLIEAVGISTQDLTSSNVITGVNANLSGILAASRARITAAAPVSSAASGSVGEIRSDTNYLYVCTATNTWKRIALSAF
jgi:hypothetical protein